MCSEWRGLRHWLALAGFLISALGTGSSGGSLSGRALDSAGRPLANVSVELAGPAVRSTRTDDAGAFSFDALPVGRYTLSVTTPLGRAEAAVEVVEGEAASRDVTLGVPRVTETISVSGEAPDGLGAVPGGTAVVDRAEILDTKANNFKDVFDLTPGVLAQPRFGADESQFSIRGSGLRNNFHVRGVNLFVNGIPYQDADGFSDFEALEFMAASRVEVWKGANALRFGGNTSGGAVNLVTQDPTDASALQLRTLGGSYGYFKGQLSSGGRLGDGGYYGSFSGLTSQGYREHSAQTRERLMGNLTIPASSDTDLVVDVMQAHVTEKLPGSLTAEEMASDPRQADPANLLFDWGRRFDYFRGGVRMNHRFGDGATLSVTGFGSYRNMDHPIFLVIDQDTRNYGGEIRYALSSTLFGRPNRLVAGFVPFFGNAEERDYVNAEGTRGPLADAFATTAGNLGLYVEDQFDLSPAVTLVIGTGAQRATRSYEDRFAEDGDRSDERTYEALTPKFGILWTAAPGIQVFANASRSYEAPLLLELKSYGSPGFLALDAQDTWQYEIGSRGKLAESSSWTWDVSLFDLEIENEIVNINVRPFPDASFTIPSYRNVPRTRHRGAEIGVGGVLAQNLFGGGRLSGRAAYTYSDFRFVDDPDYGDNVLPGAPRHLVRAELRFDAPGGFWLAPAIDASPSSYFVDSANTASNARYVVWNMTAGWDGPVFGLFLQFTNIGDTVYSAAVQVDNDLGRYFEPADGRSVAGGIRWRM
jgi:iron complex outermembrane receptor protein